jgi:hypothetical protein
MEKEEFHVSLTKEELTVLTNVLTQLMGLSMVPYTKTDCRVKQFRQMMKAADLDLYYTNIYHSEALILYVNRLDYLYYFGISPDILERLNLFNCLIGDEHAERISSEVYLFAGRLFDAFN